MYKLEILRDNARYLRLLQHDFRNEDLIRIVRMPPGKIAPVCFPPRKNMRLKFLTARLANATA